MTARHLFNTRMLASTNAAAMGSTRGSCRQVPCLYQGYACEPLLGWGVGSMFLPGTVLARVPACSNPCLR